MLSKICSKQLKPPIELANYVHTVYVIIVIYYEIYAHIIFARCKILVNTGCSVISKRYLKKEEPL